ncbi:MAG: cyclic nucleotide-binding domain-containing protein [Proteobacteria bacterium]|nr:cyclic nucleotide-binding domain-containing protein [Pseudomonadota bacterium]
MTMKEEVEVLRNIPLFAKLDTAKLKLLAFTSERLTFEAGQALFNQGDPGDAAYIMIEGEADVLVDTANGKVAVARLARNAIIGEIAILCDVPRTATVIAYTKLTTLRIDKETFFRLVTEFPQMAVEIMRELARRLDKTTEQLRQCMSRVGAASA